MADLSPHIDEGAPAPLTAAERYAALSALRAGLDSQIAAAKRDLMAEASGLRKASWPTPWGQVNAVRADPRVEIDQDALLEHLRAHHPDGIVVVETPNVALVQTLLARCTVIGRTVMDRETGEVVEWAHVGEAGPLTVSYPASAQQKDAKALATMLFDERGDALVSGLREVTA